MTTDTATDELAARLQAEIARLKEENQKLRANNRRWMRIAGTDDLTGLPNKIYFTTALLPQQISLANAENIPVACVMLAPDRLGDINQEYGRKGGDQVVQEIARFLQDNLAEGEKLVHLDGANFIVLIPRADLRQARRRSLTFRARAISQHFDCCEKKITLSLSMGVVCRSPSPAGSQSSTREVVDEFLKKLAAALDQAKQEGGDQAIEDPETEF